MQASSNHKIKLGIDAKWYFKGPPSGNMVVKNLVDEMVTADNQHFDLYLLITREFKEQAIAHFPACVKLVFLPGLPNLVNNMLMIPVYARKHGLQVILYQNFSSLWPKGLLKVVYIHDVLFLDYPQYYSEVELFYFKKMKSLAAKADMIITISNAEKDRLIKNKVLANNNIAVVHHGINSNFKVLGDYSPARIRGVMFKYNLPQQYLLYVGRVNIRKNISRLVSALNLLDDNSIKLVIAGGLDNRSAALKEQIEYEQLSHRIIFTGHVPESDLYLIYANAVVFCFPSYAEGFGLPPLEAMQCGVPVIVSDRTAMPEICGNAAIYVDPDDTLDIANKINVLLGNNELYTQKAQEGIEHVKQFNWPKSAKSILNLISDAYNN